jgi:hypothetical protein
MTNLSNNEQLSVAALLVVLRSYCTYNDTQTCTARQPQQMISHADCSYLARMTSVLSDFLTNSSTHCAYCAFSIYLAMLYRYSAV